MQEGRRESVCRNIESFVIDAFVSTLLVTNNAF